ncbi:MAG: cusB 1 [Chthoniobacter sp.]|nr:cusB 1 [Chthoniobacter sp.]
MKTRFALLLLLIATAAGATGWWLGHRHTEPHRAAGSAERKVLFYQSPMHPWIKSEQPGNCTICGMKLVPVMEGQPDGAATSETTTKLSASSLSVVDIQTATVTRQPLKRTLRVAGTIDDDDSKHRRLSAYVDARIDKLFVNFVGAEVTAGEPLASLYSRDLLVARSEYAQAVRRPASPERETFLAASTNKLRRMGLTLEQIAKLPGQTGDTFDLVAPASGTVVERKVYEGQYVKEGDVLFEIADFTRMWFVFDAYERDLAWLRVGQSVEITTPSVPGKTFTAPVAFIDPNLVPATRSAKVRVVLENPHLGDPAKHQHELLHKVFAEGRIHAATEPVLAVPRTAVLSAGGGPLVYVAKTGHDFEPRAVTLGRAGDEVWEIVAGLQENERVVTTGNLLIDAQAQLDRPQQVVSSGATTAEPSTPAQHEAVKQLMETASAVGEALASDDLAAHNTRIAALHSAAMKTAEELGAAGRRLGEVAHVGEAKDLVAARKQFYPVSMAVAEIATALRKRDRSAVTAKVFECPMARSAVPSADTNQGRWVQLNGPIRNPFFGAEMLECGAEVKP